MKVIRRKLQGGETFPKNKRYNETTDTVEVSYDDGVTWQDYIYADPRTSPALIKTNSPRDTVCDTAANVRAFMQNTIQGALNIMDDFGTAAGVVGALVTLLVAAFLALGPYGVLVALFFALAGYLVELGSGAIEYAFIDGEWDIVLCNIRDFTPADGIYTQTMLDDIIAQNTTTLNVTAAGVVDGMLLLMGPVGMTNAGRTGENTADCTGCAECVTFDAKPTSGKLFQLKCVSSQNWLQFNTSGAYTNLGRPNGFGCYFDCEALCPRLGGATGWKVTVTYTGTKTLYRCTGVNPNFASPCYYNAVTLSGGSGTVHTVPSTHPAIAIQWIADSGGSVISNIKVECDFT